MKAITFSMLSGTGAAALLFLGACQQSDSPVQPEARNAGAQSQEAGAGSETKRMVGEGVKGTDEETARFLAEMKNRLGTAPAGANPSALAKAAALPVCRVGFDNTASLAAVKDQANQAYSVYPHYAQTCNTSYTVSTGSVNSDYYRLYPEDNTWCAGPVPLIGHQSGAYCYDHTQGKYWPRRAGNMGGKTGVEFWVTDALYYKNWEMKSLYVYSGTVEVEAYIPGTGVVHYYNLTPGTWTWPAGTIMSNLKVYSNGRNGYIRFDNVDIAIRP